MRLEQRRECMVSGFRSSTRGNGTPMARTPVMALFCCARAQYNSERPNSVERTHPCSDQKSPGYSKCDFRCQLSLATIEPITPHTPRTSPTKNR
jgi:hypothetical protein